MKRGFKRALQWFVALGCVGYIVRFLLQNRSDLRLVVAFSPPTIGLLLGLSATYLALHSYRYQIVLEKCSGSRIPVFPWFKLFALSTFLNQFIPQTGTVYRGIRLKQDYHVAYTRYVSSYASFAWIDTFLNLIFAFVVLSVAAPGLRLWGLGASKLLLTATGLVIAGPILFEAVFSRIRIPDGHIAWVHSKLAEALTVSVRSLRDWRYMLKLVLLNLVVFAVVVTLLYACFQVLNVRASLPALALFYVLHKMSGYVIVTPGNLGVLELAYGLIGKQMQVGMAQAVIVVAMLRVLSFVVLVPFGLACGGVDLLRNRSQYQGPDA